jgi:cell division protein FtsB
MDKLMLKMNSFFGSNFFLMMIHGLQFDMYLAIFVNLTANLKASTPNGINIFFSVLIGLSLILYTIVIHSLTKSSLRRLKRQKRMEKLKEQKEKGEFQIMDISDFDFDDAE